MLFKLIASIISIVNYAIFRSTFGWWDPRMEAMGKQEKRAGINGVLKGVSWGENVWLGLGKWGMRGWEKDKRDLAVNFGGL